MLDNPAAVIIVSVFVGLIAGGGGSLVGAGGGFIVMPYLLLVLKYEHPVAVATSLVAVLATGSGSTFAYARQKRIDYRSGIIMTLGMIPGVFAGAMVTHWLDGAGFQIAFGLVLTATAGVMIRRALQRTRAGREDGAPEPRKRPTLPGTIERQVVDVDGVRHEYPFNIPLALLAALLAGTFSAAFGIGGGMILVPILAGLMAMPVHVATSTSTFVMIPMALLGIINHTVRTPFDVPTALALAAGVLIGSQIGARVSRVFRPVALAYVVAAVVSALALLLVIRGFQS